MSVINCCSICLGLRVAKDHGEPNEPVLLTADIVAVTLLSECIADGLPAIIRELCEKHREKINTVMLAWEASGLSVLP